MKKVLVTGAAGFIGSHVVRELSRRKSCDVLALDDLYGGFRENIPVSIDFVEASITDKEKVESIFRRYDIDYVYHLAAYAAEGLSPFIRRFNYKNNLIGSINLINQSIKREIDCFVFASSIAVYGENQVPMRESMTPSPEDPYGIAKYAVELDLEEASDRFGLDYVIFRSHNVYGEFQNIGDKYRNVVGIFMNQILRGEPMTIFGDGKQKRAFSYVKDVVPPIVEAPWTEGALNRVFNVGADTPHSVNELAQEVAMAMGKPDHPVVHLEERNEVEVAYGDHSALEDAFGEHSETPLREDLEKMTGWVGKVGAWEAPPFGEVEVEKSPLLLGAAYWS